MKQYDEIAEDYIKNQREFFSDREDWTRLILHQRIKQSNGQKVLDVGCGSGDDVKKCEESGLEAYGIDVSEKMCSVAQSSIGHPERIKIGTYEQIPFEDQFFDVIFGRYSLHYLKNFNKAYLEMGRVLRPGGTLLQVVSHPIYDNFIAINSNNKETISVKLYNGKITVTFPLHKLGDYFSSVFFEQFELNELAESPSSVDAENPHELPETLFFRAIRK